MEVTGEEEEMLRLAGFDFIERVTDATIQRLLDKLLSEKVLNDAETEAVREEKGRAHRARRLIDMVRRKGDEASLKMISALHQLDPNLHQHLGLDKPCKHSFCHPKPKPIFFDQCHT